MTIKLDETEVFFQFYTILRKTLLILPFFFFLISWDFLFKQCYGSSEDILLLWQPTGYTYKQITLRKWLEKLENNVKNGLGALQEVARERNITKE